jgi:hypothetical protein
MTRSYVRTEQLEALYLTEPERAAQVEQFCFVLLATRGPLEILQCAGILGRVNDAVSPWVKQIGAGSIAQAARTDDVSAHARNARAAGQQKRREREAQERANVVGSVCRR